jgi:hypothetical protein
MNPSTALTYADSVLDMALMAMYFLSRLGQPQRKPPLTHRISVPVYAMPPIAAQFQTSYQAPVPPEMMAEYKTAEVATAVKSSAASTGSSTSTSTKTATDTSSSSSPEPPKIGTSPTRQTPWYPYDRRNRIDVIRRLCSLQQPDGRWEPGAELAELVELWGRRTLMAPAHGVTALTHACLADLCGAIWAAQRVGRENAVLSPAELISLQMVHWDLSWAKTATDRAAAWMDQR